LLVDEPLLYQYRVLMRSRLLSLCGSVSSSPTNACSTEPPVNTYEADLAYTVLLLEHET
jgi:hypothetical protein